MESFMGEGNAKKLLSLLRFQDEFRDEVEKDMDRESTE